ncbi:hypothetical protein EVAR_70543_1 [Eumeta japonica]|uniref:Uncharacterized protein n=1 Tax=Eumeta variegata TaxID=151549 RepID=A0A4C1SIG7_EUMVA|nr:hypothetical protein EVAR_70543_1 [Eumeta japonica]
MGFKTPAPKYVVLRLHATGHSQRMCSAVYCPSLQSLQESLFTSFCFLRWTYEGPASLLAKQSALSLPSCPSWPGIHTTTSLFLKIEPEGFHEIPNQP